MKNQSSLLKTQKVHIDGFGIDIQYTDMGNPESIPILLLHGVPENLQGWYATAPLLAKKFRVLAIDWPGFGGSDPLESPSDYTSFNFAKVITDFMDALGIPKAVLLATDIALLPALIAGLHKPERFSRLIVTDGIPFLRPQHSSWELRSFTRKGSIIGKALVEWFPAISAQIAYFKGFYKGHSIPKEIRKEFLVDGKSKITQEAFLSYFQNFHLGQKYFEPRAKDVQTPVLVIWGKHDRFINVKLAYEIADKLPNAQLEIIENAGHYVHMDKPEELSKVVYTFLEQSKLQAVV